MSDRNESDRHESDPNVPDPKFPDETPRPDRVGPTGDSEPDKGADAASGNPESDAAAASGNPDSDAASTPDELMDKDDRRVHATLQEAGRRWRSQIPSARAEQVSEPVAKTARRWLPYAAAAAVTVLVAGVTIGVVAGSGERGTGPVPADGSVTAESESPPVSEGATTAASGTETSGPSAPVLDGTAACGTTGPFPAEVFTDGIAVEEEVLRGIRTFLLRQANQKQNSGSDMGVVGPPVSVDEDWVVIADSGSDSEPRELLLFFPGSWFLDEWSPGSVKRLSVVDGKWSQEDSAECIPVPGLLDGVTWAQMNSARLDGGELIVTVSEIDCTSGRDPSAFLNDPVVVETHNSVTVSWTSEAIDDGARCPSNPEVERVVPLAEPLGNRNLFDGRTIPPSRVTLDGRVSAPAIQTVAPAPIAVDRKDAGITNLKWCGAGPAVPAETFHHGIELTVPDREAMQQQLDAWVASGPEELDQLPAETWANIHWTTAEHPNDSDPFVYYLFRDQSPWPTGFGSLVTFSREDSSLSFVSAVDCEPRYVLEEGLSWAEVGDAVSIGESLFVELSDLNCSGGRDPGEFLQSPVVRENEGVVSVMWTTAAPPEGSSCEEKRSVWRQVPLEQPLADRTLMDDSSPQPMRNVTEIPLDNLGLVSLDGDLLLDPSRDELQLCLWPAQSWTNGGIHACVEESLRIPVKIPANADDMGWLREKLDSLAAGETLGVAITATWIDGSLLMETADTIVEN